MRLRLRFWLFALLILITVCLPTGSADRVQASLYADRPDDRQADLNILQTDSQGIVLELITPQLSIIQRRAGCQEMTLPGYANQNVPGAAALPVRGAILGIPQNAQPNLEILDYTVEDLPGRYTPCQTAGREPLTPPPTQPVEIAALAYLRSQRVVQLRFQPVQVDPTSGRLRLYRRLRVFLRFNLPGTPLVGSVQLPEQVDGFEGLFQSTLLNYSQARPWRGMPPGTSQTDAPEIAPTGGAYKLLLDQPGIYQLTYSDLAAAGLPVDSLDPRTFRLFNQGSEAAIQVTGEADGVFDPADTLLFYGEPAGTRYTDTNVYWLSWGAVPGVRMQTLAGAPAGAAEPATYQFTQRLEQDKEYRLSSPSGPDGDHWYWGLLYASGTPAFKDFSADLPGVDSGAHTITVRGLLRGVNAAPQHHTRIYLNNNLIDDAYWPAVGDYSFDVQAPQAYLLPGSNTLRVECPLDNGISLDAVLVNWFEIDYQRTYTAQAGLLPFEGDQPGDWQFRLGGFSSAQVEIFEISDPLNPRRVQGALIQPTAGGYEALFQDSLPAGRRYLALEPGARLTPQAIQADASSDLHNPANGADYLVISHASFIPALQPLAAHRQSQGLRVKVVDVQDIYDEFSAGLFSPPAIRDFLAYAYAHWIAPAPLYVLLVGDGHFDFKNNYGWNEPNYLPPYLGEFDPWIGETASDSRYASISGADALPDLYIGRFPVRTVQEADTMVQRVLAYEQTPVLDGWEHQISLVSDNADSAGDFALFSDQLAGQAIPAGYQVDKIYYTQTHATPAEARHAILEAVNQGRLLVNYAGHAGVQYWAAESLLSVTDLPLLTNTARFPIFVPMTCLDGYFIWPSPAGKNYASIGESLVRQPGGGAIASFSPSGYGVAQGHDLLNRELYKLLLYQGETRLGAAATQARLRVYAQTGIFQELVDTYLLFGDPALQVPVSSQVYLPLFVR